MKGGPIPVFHAIREKDGRVAGGFEASTVRLYRESPAGRREIPPERSLAAYNHSPTGFEMGYSGSGPAQLALAILLEVFPQALAVELHQAFKAFIVAKHKDEFRISEVAIKLWASREAARK